LSLTDEYPLVPHYPFYGEHHILIWWTSEEQHHAIVVDSEEAVVRAFSACYGGPKQYSIPEPKSYWRGAIVRPSREMERSHAQKEYDDELRNFQGFVSSLVRGLKDSETSLPHGFRLCPKYEPDPELVDEDDPLSEEGHHFCLRCGGDGYALLPPEGMTWEGMFKVARWAYRDSKMAHSGYVEIKGRVPDDAPWPDPEKPILVAATNAGPHARGFGFDDELRGWGAFLFCFQGEEHPIPQAVLDQAAEWNAEWEAEQAQAVAEREQRGIEYQRKRKASLDAIMKVIGADDAPKRQ